MTSQCDTHRSSRDYVEASWETYFASTEQLYEGLYPLPAPDIDLRPFIDDFISGEKGTPWTSRSKNLIEHFRNLEVEFRGSPRICHLLACCIVCLRRDPTNKDALLLFNRIVAEAGYELAEHLNTRWLVSICDTVVDTADHEIDRALALVGTLFVSTVKLAETELRLYLPQRPWPPVTRLRHGGEIYDGVQTLWTERWGDINNIFNRVERGLRMESPVAHVVETIVHRAIEGNTFINRIISTTGKKKLPIASTEKLSELKKIMSSL